MQFFCAPQEVCAPFRGVIIARVQLDGPLPSVLFADAEVDDDDRPHPCAHLLCGKASVKGRRQIREKV